MLRYLMWAREWVVLPMSRRVLWGVVFFGVLYPLLITSCSVFILPGSQKNTPFYGICIVVLVFTPALMDVYLGCVFVGLQKVLVVMRKDLEVKNSKGGTCNLKKANLLTKKWLKLSLLFKTANEVIMRL
ncbi:hypothetical protein Pcinc_029757 [Petrolisthes cinctipes]|uniref:Uncharacterized protein n=1 Tax=Petrolisthes cinctipes TaxID=88211 RepID=A0AAE1F074_PETCI|nr:hypothetical protein Pcinc_029757 [Petrolisthes cinctipes]